MGGEVHLHLNYMIGGGGQNICAFLLKLIYLMCTIFMFFVTCW